MPKTKHRNMTQQKTATPERPKLTWGGKRPGAGRPRKPKPAPLPVVGDVVWVWFPELVNPNIPERRRWKLQPRPGLVLAAYGAPPYTPADIVLSVAVFGPDGFPEARDVIGSDKPEEGCWTRRGVKDEPLENR